MLDVHGCQKGDASLFALLRPPASPSFCRIGVIFSSAGCKLSNNAAVDVRIQVAGQSCGVFASRAACEKNAGSKSKVRIGRRKRDTSWHLGLGDRCRRLRFRFLPISHPRDCLHASACESSLLQCKDLLTPCTDIAHPTDPHSVRPRHWKRDATTSVTHPILTSIHNPQQ